MRPVAAARLQQLVVCRSIQNERLVGDVVLDHRVVPVEDRERPRSAGRCGARPARVDRRLDPGRVARIPVGREPELRAAGGVGPLGARARRRTQDERGEGQDRDDEAARRAMRCGHPSRLPLGPGRERAPRAVKLPRMTAALDPDEQRLVDAIAARSDELVALLCDLIRFDTTSRADPDAPARDEAALQAHLAARLRGRRRRGRRVGAGARRRRRPSAHARRRDRLRGAPAARGALPRLGRRALAAASTATSTSSPRGARTAGSTTRSTRRSRDGRVTGRGACDMKGGIAAMVVAAEAVAAAGGLAGDLLVCTNTDEESSGVGGLACARHGVAADFAIVHRADAASRSGRRAAAPSTARSRSPGRVGPHRAGAPELARRRRGERDRQGAAPARRASTGCARTGAAGPARTIRCSTRPTSSRAGSSPTRAGP